MQKNIFTLLFLTVTCVATAQKTSYTFQPKWTVGDKKTISIVQHEKETKGDAVVEDTTTYLNAAISVLKEDNEAYYLKVVYENIAMKSAINFYERLGDELKEYANLELKYKVNKQTGKPDLQNWKEAQQFINKSFEQIDSLISNKVPDAASFLSYGFAPIKEIFESKENIEAYMTDEIGYLFFPYNKKFTTGDTLTLTERCANPFSPTDTIDQTTLVYLSKIDDAKKMYSIQSNDILDISGFKEMIKAMMGKMADAFGGSDSSKTKAANDIDSFDISYSNSTSINFDNSTSWPIEIIKTNRVFATDPKEGRNEKNITTTIIIK
ncbi:hypothetical protein ACQ33O_12205 [Ferruginibacter sp. SUN002]|uniref:hypothetical protein n=1 Tax=Ferruginibacter sp. SUN002 TaxID=2937789 RepID=UPI003D366156